MIGHNNYSVKKIMKKANELAGFERYGVKDIESVLKGNFSNGQTKEHVTEALKLLGHNIPEKLTSLLGKVKVTRYKKGWRNRIEETYQKKLIELDMYTDNAQIKKKNRPDQWNPEIKRYQSTVKIG